jgi:hypothetical protein
MDATKLSPDDWTSERLQLLIDKQIPEDFRLDYKGADALPLPKIKDRNERDNKRKEIGKDATAFANSGGGVIIYGIREKTQGGRPIPERLDPVSAADVSQDQLTQIIADNSEPTLVDFRVITVRVPGQDDPAQVCYVVIISKSDTAHMASDGRYYYRNEATTKQMRDWQVRDAMNRRKLPDVTLKMEILPAESSEDTFPRKFFQIAISNVGKTIALNYCVDIHFPMSLQDPTSLKKVFVDIDESEKLQDYRETKVDGVECYCWTFSNSSNTPLFPGRTIKQRIKFSLDPKNCPRDEWYGDLEIPASIAEVRIELFADDMPPRKFTLPFSPSLLSS